MAQTQTGLDMKGLPEQARLVHLRTLFQDAVSAEQKWREQAKEDIEFYAGQQWNSKDVEKLKEQDRPAITLNKIRSTVNLLSGYQRLNRYDPSFLPRTAADLEKCKVAEGVTRYLFDMERFDSIESRVALNAYLTGRGWYYVSYEWDWETMEGDINIECLSPFDVYLDPECTKSDLSDAEYVHFARWVPKEKIKRLFPEAAEIVDGLLSRYDQDEQEAEFVGASPIWHATQTHKARLVTTWYRTYETQINWRLPDGTYIEDKEADDWIRIIAERHEAKKGRIRVATYLGDLLLEDMYSPYEHGRFPFVMCPAYWLGEGDTPAGVVRDLKDPQRELNKRRSQFLHILNTMANRGWLVEKGSMAPDDKRALEEGGSTPGKVIEYNGANKPEPFATDQIPSAFFQIDAQSLNDMREISGVNEAMMGLSPASQSGRAKELDQRQAVVQITQLFDELKAAKRRVLELLWGGRKRKGLVQQFYTEPRVFRIITDTGQQDFIQVNTPVTAGVNPYTGQAIQEVMNDLATFDFDIVISDTPATPSQRLSAFYALLEMTKYGVPIPPDVMIEASDIPQKEQIKERIMAAQQQPQQQSPQPSPPNAPPGQPGAPAPPQGQGPSQQQILQAIAQMGG